MFDSIGRQYFASKTNKINLKSGKDATVPEDTVNQEGVSGHLGINMGEQQNHRNTEFIQADR